MPDGAPSVLGRGLLGLLDQHHRDPIADGITAAATPANEAVAFLAERTVVRRAHEDLEQLLIDRHAFDVSRSSHLYAGQPRHAEQSEEHPNADEHHERIKDAELFVRLAHEVCRAHVQHRSRGDRQRGTRDVAE